MIQIDPIVFWVLVAAVFVAGAGIGWILRHFQM